MGVMNIMRKKLYGKSVCVCVRACTDMRGCVFNSTLQKKPLIGGGLYEPEEGSVISSRPPPVPLK